MNIIYRYRDLKTERAHFRGDPRFGRTTKLVHRPTGTVLFEAMGVVPKSTLHIAFLKHSVESTVADAVLVMAERNAEDASRDANAD